MSTAPTGAGDAADWSGLRAQAIDILRANDRGGYTVPSPRLYPFQWNWDSCLCALGIAAYDEDRAFTEIETLFAHQWPDGMVPSIVFHAANDGYFPGADVWRTGRPVPTSGITQPPVAGHVLKAIVDRARDRAMARERARALLVPIDRWHDWFYACRDPGREGLVAILHPWESGRDNAVDWDAALACVPTAVAEPFQRRDLDHADAAHRPGQDDYNRYVWLLELFRGLGWDSRRLHDASPFRIVDAGFNAILIRSCADLAELAETLGAPDIAAANRARAQAGLAALDRLWDDGASQYLCHDRVSGEPGPGGSSGGLLGVFAPVPPARAAAIAERIGALAARSRFLVASHDPADPRFEAQRYWRGPVWLVVNHMIADGLEHAGQAAVAAQVRASSRNLVASAGFAEYFDPQTGKGCGGDRFSWTAAMVLAGL